MDISTALSQMAGHINVESLALFVLLVISEVLGTVNSVKASSIYNVFKAVFMTVMDQVWPKATAAPVAPTSTTTPSA